MGASDEQLYLLQPDPYPFWQGADRQAGRRVAGRRQGADHPWWWQHQENGVLDQVHAALAGRHCVEFAGIEANPHFETLMRAVEVVKAEGIDYILVGGGSVIDGSKFIAAAARYEGDAWEILQTYGSKIRDAVPLGPC